jgi:hypothetical protein
MWLQGVQTEQFGGVREDRPKYTAAVTAASKKCTTLFWKTPPFPDKKLVVFTERGIFMIY